METKSSPEMSLDEVLSSIKKMVIDEEPPVLELTDMVSEDGSIVSIKKEDGIPSLGTTVKEKNSSEMSAFLKLIQDDIPTSDMPVLSNKQNGAQIDSRRPLESDTRDDKLSQLIKDAMTPLLKSWLDEHLPDIVTKAVEKEVRDFLFTKQK